MLDVPVDESNNSTPHTNANGTPRGGERSFKDING
jgi:hypothetical protein